VSADWLTAARFDFSTSRPAARKSDCIDRLGEAVHRFERLAPNFQLEESGEGGRGSTLLILYQSMIVSGRKKPAAVPYFATVGRVFVLQRPAVSEDSGKVRAGCGSCRRMGNPVPRIAA
jgi:hypothetical protein